MAVDHVLREQTGNDQDSNRFPPFRFIGLRNQIGRTINPFLVILAAEIKFRRYFAADGPRLPPVYDSLMRKTIQVAELLYFLPQEPNTIVSRIRGRIRPGAGRGGAGARPRAGAPSWGRGGALPPPATGGRPPSSPATAASVRGAGPGPAR